MSKATILIVEDEAIVAADLAGKLKQLGFEVAAMVAGGEEAVALAGRLRPDLVLMDIWLAGPMDGIAAAEAIRRQYDVAVVYLTAHSDPATLARAKLTGPLGYILKPFEERELATQIELALYKHQTDRQLRQQREWLRVTLTSIGDAVIATDAAGQITFVNLVAEALTGWTAEEAVGQPVQDVLRLVNEQTGEPLEEPVTRVLRGGRAVALANHVALLTKDGRAVPIEDIATPIRDAADQLIGAVVVFHDVTDKRRAEVTLRESEERYRSLFSRMTDSFALLAVIHDQHGRPVDYRFLDVNPAFERLMGVKRAEVIGHRLWEILPSTETHWIEHLGSAALTGEAVQFEDHLAALERWYEVLVYRPAVGQLAVVFTDVTARKQTQDDLAQENRAIALANRIMGAFVQESGDIVVGKALDAVLEATGSQHGVFGYIDDNGALVCPTMSQLLAECEVADKCINYPREKWKGLWSRALLEKRILFTNAPPAVPDGLVSVTRNLVVPILFQGQVIGLWNLANKNTDYGEEDRQFMERVANRIAPILFVWLQKEMREKERKRAEERRRLLAEVTAQLLASEQPQRIVKAICNKVMEHLGCHVFLNFLVDEEIGRLHLESCAGISEQEARGIEWLDHCVAMCGHLARDNCSTVAEHIQATPDPRNDLIRGFGLQAYACHPLMNQGQTIGTLSFGSRVKTTFTPEELGVMKAVAEHVAVATDRIRLLKSLERHARAAEAASEAKSQFLANMSHELRTPMNAILGMIDVALPKAANPTVLDCLQTAKGSADLLLTLLNDLLDSTKIESGKLELESAPFSPRQMLDQITRVLSVRASEKGLLFCCRIPEETPVALVGDRMRLQQILLNLAGNAIKFTERGEVEISLRTLSQDGGACLEFAVRDTGIGISPAGLASLFRPFAQADATTARRFGGSGLGLSISKNLVEMMGGRIWVESKVGEGSTFHFTVELALSQHFPADLPAPVNVPAAASTSLHILLAEDNPANRKLARYILEDRGHVVDYAGDGQEAICLAQQNRYDVILMDVQMPGLDGLEATAAIRQRESGSHRVPIIALTAHAMKGVRDQCLAAGMDDYLSKPVNAQEMIRLVEGLARGAAPGPQVAADMPSLSENTPPDTVEVFNLEEALTRCFNSRKVVREMAQYFVDEVDSIVAQMRAALEKGDLMKVGQLGHQMMGTLVYLGAQPATEAALRVERFCKSSDGTPSEAEEAINAFQQACETLKTTLAGQPLMAERAQGA